MAVRNVKDFGAAGDGVTDDTAAIQAAVDAAANGGVVEFPRGDYYVQASVQLRDRVRLVGYGARIVKRSSSDWIAAFYTLSFRGAGYGSGASNWRIEGFDFRGVPGVKACAISLHHAQDYQIVDCRFIDAQGALHAIDMQGCRRGVIERCHFLGYEPGEIDKEAIQIDHSYRGGGPLMPESTANASRYDGIGCRDITVRGCVAGRSATKDAPNLVGSHSFIEGNVHRRIRIEDNYLEVTVSQVANAAERRGAVHFVCAEDVQIVGNTFQCIASATQTAIRFRGNASAFPATQWQTTSPTSIALGVPMNPANITVRDNTFLDFNAEENGLLVHFWGVGEGAIQGITVDGNTFRNCAAPSGGLAGVNLLYFERCKSAMIIGNTADRSRQFIYGTKTQGLVASGNTSAASSFVSIRAVASNGTVIRGNVIEGSDEFVLVESASTNTVIEGNAFLNKTGSIRSDAIMVRGVSSGFLINDNVIRGGTGTMANGIRIEGASSGGAASGNLIDPAYGTAVSVESGSSATVMSTVVGE